MNNFDSVTTLSQTDVKSFCAGEGIRGPFVLVCGNLHTASFVMPPVTRGTSAIRSTFEPRPLGKALDVSVDEERLGPSSWRCW